MKNNINNKSPLRYPGGKTRACKIIDNIMSENFNLNNKTNIVSPFLGGGSFEFFSQNKYNWDIIANDKFKPLYLFWNICTQPHNKNIMIQNLYKSHGKIDKEHFKQCRDEILTDINNINIATNYFIINRCSFSGATLSGGFSLESSKNRFTKTSIDRINKLNLNKFNIYNEDFSTFIPKYNNR